MGGDAKGEIRRALDLAERGVTRSVIRWKYRKEGRQIPTDTALEEQSKEVVDRAHRIIARSGKSVWNELKQVYAKQKSRTEGEKD